VSMAYIIFSHRFKAHRILFSSSFFEESIVPQVLLFFLFLGEFCEMCSFWLLGYLCFFFPVYCLIGILLRTIEHYVEYTVIKP
jgi:hypothetical protein